MEWHCRTALGTLARSTRVERGPRRASSRCARCEASDRGNYPDRMTTRPLDGVRVLDFTRVLSGPHAARTLCDLGADVIKVEPPDGDMTRFANPRVNGLATYFIQQNAGKRNISLDTAKPEAVEIAARPRGQLRRAARELPARRDGPDRARLRSVSRHATRGSSTRRSAGTARRAVGAPAGVRAGGRCRDRDHQGAGRRPIGGQYANDPHSHADVYTALEAASAILAALFNRERTGRGDRIEVSMAQTMLYVNEHAHDQLWDGDVPTGTGSAASARRLPGADRGQRRDRGHQRPSGRTRHVRAVHRPRSADRT